MELPYFYPSINSKPSSLMIFCHFLSASPQSNAPEHPHSADEHQTYQINTPKLLHDAMAITIPIQLFITIFPLFFLIYR